MRDEPNGASLLAEAPLARGPRGRLTMRLRMFALGLMLAACGSRTPFEDLYGAGTGTILPDGGRSGVGGSPGSGGGSSETGGASSTGGSFGAGGSIASGGSAGAAGDGGSSGGGGFFGTGGSIGTGGSFGQGGGEVGGGAGYPIAQPGQG